MTVREVTRHQPGQLAGHRETQSNRGGDPRDRVSGCIWLEDPLSFGLLDTRPIIADLDPDLGSLLPRSNGDLLSAVPPGVAQEIAKYLSNSRFICRGPKVATAKQLHGGAGLVVEDLDHRFHRTRDVDLLWREGDGADVGPSRNEEILDNVGYISCLFRDQIHELLLLGWGEAGVVVSKLIGQANHSRQRRTQLVADRSDELIFGFHVFLKPTLGATKLCDVHYGDCHTLDQNGYIPPPCEL